MSQFLPYRNVLNLLLLFVLLLSFSSAVWAESSDPVQPTKPSSLPSFQPELIGALCLIRSDDRLLLIREYITHKLSLPGGTIKKGEDPRVTAQRETWEESGIAVDVLDELGRTESAIIYNCQVQSEIIAYNNSNRDQRLELPIFNAPHFGVEVLSAQLVLPKNVNVSQYRYAYQWPLVEHLFESANNQSIRHINHLIDLAPSYQRVQLSWLNSLQTAVKHGPSWLQSMIMLGGEALNLVMQPLILLILLPVFIWQWGRIFTAELVFACVTTSLFVLVTKQGFSLPLPHAYLPSINFTQQSGYSFPDIYLANWSCISLIVMSQIERYYRSRFLIIALVSTAILVFYQFISGAAFLTDMLVGSLIGMLSGWHFVRHYLSNSRDQLAIFIGVKAWSIVLTVAALLTITWPHPSFIGWTTLSLGMLAYALINRQCCSITPMSLLELFVSVAVVIGVLSGFYHWLPSISHETSYVLLSKVSVMVLIVALPALVMFGFRRKKTL
ncbi:bifunctional NUDIX hydrolase/phosphatase PAP2 family protein [Vibrio hippocampi]|uniref:Nudix hydrolase domain-containing protein n=1 Tax=Vibrio hippocampi TaxID=654686 RepID=A0ABN8DFI5_9VIBR|nr:NUDIX domain-containing protein [Vibrio hippocampi]CAH0526035.1 hypothetical protein VHP8226_01521 [Vibrio hippocampi]